MLGVLSMAEESDAAHHFGHVFVVRACVRVCVCVCVCVCLGLTSFSTIISRQCLVATGSSMLTFIMLPHRGITFIMLPHRGIKSQTLDLIQPPVTLY